MNLYHEHMKYIRIIYIFIFSYCEIYFQDTISLQTETGRSPSESQFLQVSLSKNCQRYREYRE